MDIPKPIVPEADSSVVKEILKSLNLKKALKLKVEPIRDGQINDCFANVQKAITSKGGRSVYGWKIWETLPGVMIEAEFHAVWVSPRGSWLEVSPQRGDFSEVLFARDTNMENTGEIIDNIRIALVSDSLVDDFIRNAEARYSYMNSGSLKDKTGYVAIDPALRVIQDLHEELRDKIFEKYYLNRHING